MTPHEALSLALADAAARGAWIPCSTSDAWTAEDTDPDERGIAAELCRSCPALAECAAAGESEVWGIWAGVWRGRTFKPRPVGRPRKAAS